MIIRDEMRVERTNIIFGLCGNNTDLQTVRIKEGWLGREERGSSACCGSARASAGSSARDREMTDGSRPGFACLALGAMAVGGGHSPKPITGDPRGSFPPWGCREGIHRGGGVAAVSCTRAQHCKMNTANKCFLFG